MENQTVQQPQPTNSAPQQPDSNPDEINLLEYIYVLVKNKWWIIGLTVLGLVIGYVAARVKGPTWVAEVLISPKERESQKATSLADLGAFGGLVASQLNIEGGSTSLNMMDMILDGRDFGARMIERYSFLPAIYKYEWPEVYNKYWDRPQNRWTSDFVQPKMLAMGGLVRSKYLKKSRDTKKNTILLMIKSKDSAFTNNLSTMYINYLSEYIKIKVQTEAKENGAYLDSQLVTIVDPILRMKIIGLLATEIEKQMVVSRESFKIADPLYLYRTYKEKKMYPVLFGVAMFFMVCFIIILKQLFSSVGGTENDLLLLKKIKKELFLVWK